MNTIETDENLTRRAREVFFASVEALPPGVLARLREARLKALEAAEVSQSGWAGWRIPAGAMALVSVAVVAGALWWNGLTGPVAAPETFNTAANSDDALPIVLTSDSLDMYADLDFYQWLETQDKKAKPTTPPADQTDDSEDSDDSGVGG